MMDRALFRIGFAGLCSAIPLVAQFELQTPRPTPFGSGLTGTTAIAADLNGDGRNDFVFATTTGLRIFVTLPRGIREIPVPAVVEPEQILTLRAGDIDGDGDLDVFVGHATADSFWLRNDGVGGMNVAPSALPPRVRTKAAVLLDLDGDGDLDLAVGGTGDEAHVSAWRNDGRGTFTPFSPPGFALPFSPLQMEIGDVDGDGRADIVAVGSLTNLARLQFNGTTWQNHPQFGGFLPPFVVADLDGDGRADVVANAAFGPAVVYRSTVSGLETVRFLRGKDAERDATVSLATIDFDGDGDLDLWLGTQYGTGFTIWRNDGAMTFTRIETDVPPLASTRNRVVLSSDLDGDGDRDLVAFAGGSPIASDIAVAYRDGTGWTEASAAAFAGAPPGAAGPLVEGVPNHVVFASERDGIPHVFTYRHLSLNDGFGRFAPTQRATTLPEAAYRLADFDGDGDLDVLAVSPAGWDVYENVAGDFVRVNTGLQRVSLEPQLADFDGDGRLDILDFSPSGNIPPSLLLGDGAFGFVAAPNAFPPMSRIEFAWTHDLDGDGDRDIVGLTKSGNHPFTVLVLRNDRGRFVDVTATAIPASLPTSYDTRISIGDFDGDGVPDLLVWSQQVPDGSILLHGTPGLRFDYGPSVRGFSGTRLPQVVHVGDFDGDGRADVLHRGPLVGQTGVLLRLALHRGDGVFVEDPAWLGDASVPLAHDSFAVADVDLDGDLDLIAMLPGATRTEPVQRVLFVNEARRLLANAPPRLGAGAPSPFALTVRAEPGIAVRSRSALPLLGFASVRVALPFGLLRVDLATAVVLPAVTLPAPGGEATVTIPIPDDASLLGVRLVTQALIVDPVTGAKFTNALVEHVR